MKHHLTLIQNLINNGGLTSNNYDIFEKCLQQIANELACGKLFLNDLQTIRSSFGDALSENTSQGLAFLKKRGYAGDFEVIDRIYRQHLSENEKFCKWDMYFNQLPCVVSVRNRKTYFIELLQSIEKMRIDTNSEKFNVLNIASGSGRDVREFFMKNPVNGLFFDCIDQDADAVYFAKNLCADYLSQIEFYKANALRFRSDKKYNLIWSAGLFDYFNDKTFKFMLKRCFSMLENDGEIIVGNASDPNPNKIHMEMLEWFLNYRSGEKLMNLALECELPASSIFVEQEPLGLNLFLRIKK